MTRLRAGAKAMLGVAVVKLLVVGSIAEPPRLDGRFAPVL
jgi:hypothetical protein